MAETIAALLPAGLALLMFAAGLRLQWRDLGTALRSPRALAFGLMVQVLGLPAAAYGLAQVFRLPPEMAAGLILTAAAPGGVTSNYISVLVRADIALSAAMTLCTTLLCSLTIPAVLLLAGTGIEPGPGALGRISLSMAAVALLPLLAGLLLASAAPAWTDQLRRVLDPAARALFLAIVGVTVAQSWPAIAANFAAVGPACFMLNFFALGAAFAAGTIAGLSRAQRQAIMVEASLQNVAVTIFLAGSVLGKPALAVPGLVYVFAMNLSALVQIALAGRRARRVEQAR